MVQIGTYVRDRHYPSQLKDDAQGRVYLSELVEGELPDVFSEATRIDRCGLFDQDARGDSVEHDLGPEARLPRGC